jgi:uncharacterized protein (DUF3084 family)
MAKAAEDQKKAMEMEAMHAANEKAKAEEDQKKAMEMEAMHAANEKAKAEEDQKKAKDMEVRGLMSRYTTVLPLYLSRISISTMKTS